MVIVATQDSESPRPDDITANAAASVFPFISQLFFFGSRQRARVFGGAWPLQETVPL